MFETINDKKIFVYGRDNPQKAVEAAAECKHYSEDYDEECFYDDERSCYNCRYRRWTEKSFECMKKE